MATVDDVEVANASFPNVRQDLNDILEAITTNFSADTEPTTTYPNQFWYETDTNLLYIRNEADDAWITLASINQTTGEWEPRTAVIQAIDSAGIALKTDDGTTRFSISDAGVVSFENYAFPSADGSANQVLTTDGSGTLTFEDAGAGDKIEEGNSSVEVVDSGTGHVAVTVDGSETARFDANGRLGIGTNSPSELLTLSKNAGHGISLVRTGTFPSTSRILNSNNALVLESNGSTGMIFETGGTPSEAARIDSSGHVLVGKTALSFATAGSQLYPSGEVNLIRDSGDVLYIKRLTNDGNLVNFYQDASQEGNISVSGSTVSYNGGHLSRWSQTIDDSRIDGLVKGTVLSNLDEMCEWKRVEFEYQALVSEAVEAQDEVLDEEGNVVQEAVEAQDAVYEPRTNSESYDGDANVGDVIDWEYEGETVQATVILEDNEQLNRMKVSDVEGDPNVAGVFVNWDDDDDVNTADMNIAMTGDMVIRIAQGTTVQRGDLLMSAGDGTAKPQGDDIVRSKTIAKVTSTHVSHTYDDGSYLVPCVLMAC